MTTIGILSPGAMGAALGRAWQRGGARVVTTVAGRSARTQALAEGLEWLNSTEAVVAAADVVVSVVPPAGALANARQIAEACRTAGVRPVVADLNAIAPPAVTEIVAVLESAGCPAVDGSISGPPPATDGSRTRLYLSGPSADILTGLDSEGLTTAVIGDAPGQASALKMCTAAVYKGLTGLMIQSLQTADTFGVAPLVAADYAEMLGAVGQGAAHRVAVATSKSDRFPDEMREIAATQGDAGFGNALYLAMAEVYDRANQTRLAELSPEEAEAVTELETVLEGLRTPRP